MTPAVAKIDCAIIRMEKVRLRLIVQVQVRVHITLRAVIRPVAAIMTQAAVIANVRYHSMHNLDVRRGQ